VSRNKLFDQLVIIDLEATCDDPRPKWQGEIIEVGVCLLDLNSLDITKPRGILVHNTKTPITDFCTKLTTLTQEMINKDGVFLCEAMRILKEEYLLEKRTWASWGDYDRKTLLRCCENAGEEFPGRNSTHINLKNLLAIELGLPYENGLDGALARFNMKLEGTHHRGVDDALNIARVYRRHLEKVRCPDREPFDRSDPDAGYPKGWDL